ncbi:MAG: lactate utilization protein C [Myxococcota bacterium]
MSVRDRILARVHRTSAGRVHHPGVFRPPAMDGELWSRFVTSLDRVGGEWLGPLDPERLAPSVRELCQRRGAGRVVGLPDVQERLGEGPWRDVPAGATPHSLAGVNVTIAVGLLGVAESAAVAVRVSSRVEHAALVLCEHLVVLLERALIVPELHTASARVASLVQPSRALLWLSGPSKTADIEQTLVLGAHGARTLTVVGLDPPRDPTAQRAGA